MKIAVLGAGAMGSVIGGLLARGGHDVTLVDVHQGTIDAINAHGLKVENKEGKTETIRVRATDAPMSVGEVDVVLVFVKCYHTAAAVASALPMMGPNTVVLSLQNGWGNGPCISRIVGEGRLLVGVCYHSATVAGAGRVQHVGKGMTFMGELDGKMSERLNRIAKGFRDAGVEVTATPTVLNEIWSKLALNACTLPTSALLRFYAPQLAEHEPTRELMRALLGEVATVARAQGIATDFDERWEAIIGLLKRCSPHAKSSMLQDVEKGRRTEIDVINGAIVEAGQRLGIPTPYNEAMVKLIKSLEGTFQSA